MTELTDQALTAQTIKQSFTEMLREQEFAACLIELLTGVGARKNSQVNIAEQSDEMEESPV
jgi:hypothetical protein